MEAEVSRQFVEKLLTSFSSAALGLDLRERIEHVETLPTLYRRTIESLPSEEMIWVAWITSLGKLCTGVAKSPILYAVSSSGGAERTMQQRTFASVAWEKKGKVTRRERFLAEMDAVIPWTRLLALIEPHYPKAGNGTQPKPMEQMLRIYFMQNWFNLSDPQAEDSLYDIESMRRFAGIELLGHDIPDESTILRFRHLLEQQQLTERESDLQLIESCAY